MDDNDDRPDVLVVEYIPYFQDDNQHTLLRYWLQWSPEVHMYVKTVITRGKSTRKHGIYFSSNFGSFQVLFFFISFCSFFLKKNFQSLLLLNSIFAFW